MIAAAGDYGVEKLVHQPTACRGEIYLRIAENEAISAPVGPTEFRFVFVMIGREGERIKARVIDGHDITEGDFSPCILTPFPNLFMVRQGVVHFSVCRDPRQTEFGVPVFVGTGECLEVPANTAFRFSIAPGSILIFLPLALPEDPAYALALVLAE